MRPEGGRFDLGARQGRTRRRRMKEWNESQLETFLGGVDPKASVHREILVILGVQIAKLCSVADGVVVDVTGARIPGGETAAVPAAVGTGRRVAVGGEKHRCR